MPIRRALLLATVVGIVAMAGRPLAQGSQAALHGGISGGVVRDATKVDSTIYAVGTWNNGGRTDGALWTLDGVNPPVFTALPDFCTTGTTGCSQNVAGGEAITPNAAFFAGQARTSIGPTAVRVTRSPLANLNLTPTPPFTGGSRVARTISDDGSILYGTAGMDNGGGIVRARGLRFEGGAVTVIYPQPATNASGFAITQNILSRGASSDGTVAVGWFFTDAPFVDTRAFRYVHGTGTSLLPLLDGGTYNVPFAVTGNGGVVALVGDTPDFPVREVYTYAPSATPQVTRLGVPNLAMTPASVGGITDDGSVVITTATCTAPCSPDRYAYFHNGRGWFHLTSALGAAGVDVSGWRNLQVQGLNGDGTLLWGTGLHDGATEGFVAEFAPGYLKNFNPQPAPPASTALVGVWSFVEPGDPFPTDPDAVVVFTADGVYYHVEGEPGEPLAGFERGFYSFNGSHATLTTLFDTNGSIGLSDDNGSTFSITVSGDTLIADGEVVGYRITGSPGSIVEGWVGGNPTEAHNSVLLVFAQNKFFAVYDFPDGSQSEVGTYTWDPVSHELIATVGGVADPGNFVTLSRDGLGLHVVGDEGETFDVTRVIDPATIPVITNTPLSVSGVVGQPFSVDADAMNTVTFAATGLPNGLSINANTGEISGTPTIGGQFSVEVKATNAVGVSDIETLALTLAIPTPVGVNVVVEPEVPEGQGPITLSFGEITQEGTTTVTVLDLDSQTEVPPPGNVQIGGVVYEVTTTATYQGLITLCFSYTGIDFGEATPRLFHYESNVWVDITTSVDTNTQTICGATTSLSPFAVLVSDVVRTGFYAPLNPIAGFLNTVKGGSTVPLKFNVSLNGVEQTATNILDMTQQLISCDLDAPEDDVEPAAVTGGTSLQYDANAGHFIQNWKVPKTPGRCYMVRMTTNQDGLALTARFKVK